MHRCAAVCEYSTNGPKARTKEPLSGELSDKPNILPLSSTAERRRRPLTTFRNRWKLCFLVRNNLFTVAAIAGFKCRGRVVRENNRGCYGTAGQMGRSRARVLEGSSRRGGGIKRGIKHSAEIAFAFGITWMESISFFHWCCWYFAHSSQSSHTWAEQRTNRTNFDYTKELRNGVAVWLLTWNHSACRKCASRNIHVFSAFIKL